MNTRKIPLSSPDITDLEIDSVVSVLKTRHLSRGPKTKEFEDAMASYVGVPYAIAVNSGTSALHLAVRTLNLRESDEVITTPFSFIASSNCLLMEGVKPIFVDIDSLTHNINPDLIEEKITPKTKAILPVHVFGHPAEMDKINAIARKHNLYILEDACEAIGAEYKGQKAGNFGDISSLAFYPNKQITTGEGGMILTSDKRVADLCRSMRCHGIEKTAIGDSYERLGYNYHMDEMSAALGLAQFSRLEEILAKRERVAKRYLERLRDIEGIILPYEFPNVKKSWFVFVVGIKNGKRDDVMEFLRKNGIECKEYFQAIHLQSLYKREFGYEEGDFPVTERTASQNLALPFYNNLNEGAMDYVVEKLREGIKNAA